MEENNEQLIPAKSNKFNLFVNNKYTKLVLHFLAVTALVLLGIIIGLNYNSKKLKNQGTAEKPATENAKCVNPYADEITGYFSLGNGKLISKVNENYSREKLGVYSPLLEGKSVEINTYNYKSKTIIEKNIKLDDYSSLSIWQYDDFKGFAGEKVEDFAIFRGYENYSLSAEPVKNIIDSWCDLYETKNKIKMYYEYFMTPKSIGLLGLSSYWGLLPNIENSKPSIITIYYSKISGYSQNSNDLSISEAKNKINQIADTFVIGIPD